MMHELRITNYEARITKYKENNGQWAMNNGDNKTIKKTSPHTKRPIFSIFNFQFSTILLLFPIVSFAQRTVIQDTVKSGKPIVIIQAPQYNLQDKGDSTGKFLSLSGGNVIVQQERTKFYADSIVLNQKENWLEAFGNVHINDADSVHTYAQYVKYLGKEKKAFLKNKVRLTDGKGTLTTDDLDYDVNIKLGTYHNGGKVVNGKTTLTSKDGYYYGDTRDVYFYNSVEMNNPSTTIFTDTLLYNLNTEITNFVSITTIFNEKRRIVTREGFYNLKTKVGQFGKRTFIEDSTYTLTADDMSEDSTGKAELRGNAVYRSKDSKNGFDLMANNIKSNRKKNTLLATEKPILFIKQDADTIYVTADTLYAARFSNLQKAKSVPIVRDTVNGKYEFKLEKDSSNDRYFEGYNHVRIFHDSLQAVADSMFYSSVDSVFRLFTNPIVWAKENQITGDTMYLFIKNQNPEKLMVFENAMAISKVNSSYFNQLKGNRINGFFKNGKISLLNTKGSPAQNVYYAEDERKKLVGVNQSSADVINIEFINNKPEKVIFINNLQGTMFPMNQINHNEIKVKGFKWLDDMRPKTKFEILGG